MPELNLPIRHRGIMVKVLARPRPSHLRQMLSANHHARPVGPLSAYLDTGASDTMFDLAMIQSMGLEPVQSAALNILGRTEVSFHKSYEVEVALFLNNASPSWVPLTILGGAVYPTGAVAALGRDFLKHVVFTYDGPRKRVKLWW